MIIYLTNHAHNGDIFFTLEIVKIFIKSNPNFKFFLIPSCSHYLYYNLLDSNVQLAQHPSCVWNFDNMINNDNYNDDAHPFSNKNCHSKTFIYNNDILYINLWAVLNFNNSTCISLYNRVNFIKRMLIEIEIISDHIINFECNNYIDLIPTLPDFNINDILIKLKQYDKKLIFFYNLNHMSNCDIFTDNNIILNKLIEQYNEDSIIITAKPTEIKHPCLINMEDEFNIKPSLDGKNLIINSIVANNCNHVYFKNTGGCYFILNKTNIQNSNNVIYHYFGFNHYYDIIVKEFGLNCILENYENYIL